MKSFLILTMTVAIAILINACSSPAATPAINQVDVQNTAIAAAFTIVAKTKAAIPTNTPIPPTDTPTETPLPTETQAPSPTLEQSATLTPTSNTGKDPCNELFKSSVSGHFTQIRIINNSNAPVIATLYLNVTAFGECGYRGYSLGKNDEITVTDWPFGCYNVSVLVNDPKQPQKSFGYGCINNVDVWTFDIHADSVKFYGP